ncbi:MAG: prepilin-type N-terminal cleavage/methylation domain-containing protein, partial [Oscillospiraceae bacterium]|nr:prepilin-type N-terminal cleavage/methylation domain-containing protein [Oscillospiraceae bacterium]
MKRTVKKGFTIVELVIVIAVVAILAAVLIPTFASLIKKANMSVDMQIVRQMNTILQADEAVAGKPATVVQ